MFRELFIFVCAVAIVHAGASRHEVPARRKEATQSSVVSTTTAPGRADESRQYYGGPASPKSVRHDSHQSGASGHSKVYATSPSETTHQSVAHTHHKQHHDSSDDGRVEANSNVVNTISRPAVSQSGNEESYGSADVYQQSAVYDGTSNPGIFYQTGNINYAPDDAIYATATVRPHYIPSEAGAVTIESNGAVNAHTPSGFAYAGNAVTVRPYYDIPIEANRVSIVPNGHPYAAFASHHLSPDFAYASHSPTVRPFYAVPIEPNTVTIESNGEASAHHPGAYGSHHHAGHGVTYVNNPASTAPYYVVPVEANGAVNPHHPASYANHQYVDPALAYIQSGPTQRPYYAVPVQAKTVTIDSNGAVHAHPSAGYANHHFEQQSVRPYYVVPVAAKTVSFDSRRSVDSHSPGVEYQSQSPQYAASQGTEHSSHHFKKSAENDASRRSEESSRSVTARPPSAPSSGFDRYTPVAVAKPIPVPVIYQTSDGNTHHPSAQQFAFLPQNVSPTGASYAQAQVRSQQIPVRVIYPVGNHDGAPVRYQPASVPVVHANSFVERVFAPVGPTQIPVAPAGPDYGYARAASYSPASAVSSVTFNGLGVSYGW